MKLFVFILSLKLLFKKLESCNYIKKKKQLYWLKLFDNIKK